MDREMEKGKKGKEGKEGKEMSCRRLLSVRHARSYIGAGLSPTSTIQVRHAG